jgi:hypothetical protein
MSRGWTCIVRQGMFIHGISFSQIRPNNLGWKSVDEDLGIAHGEDIVAGIKGVILKSRGRELTKYVGVNSY